MSNELNFTLIAQQLGKTQADELQKLLGSVENKEQITPIVNLFLESQRKLSQENTSLKHANSEVNLALEPLQGYNNVSKFRWNLQIYLSLSFKILTL